MENTTVFKLVTEKMFTVGKEYVIINDKKLTKIKCERQFEGGWYFSTEKSKEHIESFFNNEINGKLPCDDGTLRTKNATMNFLTYVGTTVEVNENIDIED